MAERLASTPIDNLLIETRTFAVDPAFAASANVDVAGAAALSDAADADPVAFWEDKARRLDWHEPWHTAHTWRAPEPGCSPTSSTNAHSAT